MMSWLRVTRAFVVYLLDTSTNIRLFERWADVITEDDRLDADFDRVEGHFKRLEPIQRWINRYIWWIVGVEVVLALVLWWHGILRF